MCHRNDPGDEAFDRFGSEAGAWRKGDLAPCPVKRGKVSSGRCAGRSPRDERGAGSAGTLTNVIEAVAEATDFRFRGSSAERSPSLSNHSRTFVVGTVRVSRWGWVKTVTPYTD